MVVEEKQGRRKKIDWLKAAFDAFESEGIEGVRVERLARTLNVAKSGFYWHFRDRAQLYDELLDRWEQESTKAVTASVELAALDPADRLFRAAHLILEQELGRMDLYFRAWAQHCPEVHARVNEVYDMRLSWVRQIFRELGFKGDDVEMRARLFVAYHAWERIAFADQSKAQAKRLIKRRVEFFIRP